MCLCIDTISMLGLDLEVLGHSISIPRIAMSLVMHFLQTVKFVVYFHDDAHCLVRGVKVSADI